MPSTKIALPEALKSRVDLQVAIQGAGTSSEVAREPVSKDQGVQRLRTIILDGAASPAVALADDSYLENLREVVRRQAET